jgi:hypothetical protein
MNWFLRHLHFQTGTRDILPASESASLLRWLSPQDRADVLFSAQYLRRKGALRVWFLGALACCGRGLGSTFDFAVEGLPGLSYPDCLEHLMDSLPRPVELVLLETCPAEVRERVVSEGILLPD